MIYSQALVVSTVDKLIMAKQWAKQFYNSKQWKAVRLAALRRDHHTCEVCGGLATEVHHEVELTPENIGNPQISLNLRLLHSLCSDCHKEITRQQHGGKAPDCAMDYFFDENGLLSPRGLQK